MESRPTRCGDPGFPVGTPACMTWDVPEPGTPYHEWQAGRCAGCGYDKVPLVIDHDHATGMERGRLCRSCNTAEGQSNALLWRNWRRGQNPATLLGEERVYDGGYWAEAREHLESLYPEPTMDDLRAAILTLGEDYGD